MSKFLAGHGSRAGAEHPASAAPKEGVYRQEALLVIARQPRDGKETRFSVVKLAESAELLGAKMAALARDELYAALGVVENGAARQ